MEETNVMQPEATMPESGVADDTGSQPVDTTATETEEQNEVTTPEDATAAEDAQPADEPPAEEVPPEPFTVRFRHRDVDLSREEATNYAQKGMLYDELAPTIDSLRRMAAGAGKSVPELVSSIVDANERAMKARFLKEAHGDTSVAERLMKVELDRLQSAYDSSVQAEKDADESARQSLHDRLAGEFVELQADFPELKEFKDVPQSVVTEAINKGKSLYDTFLRHWRQEQKRIDQNKAAQQAAAAASTGSRAASAPASNEDAAVTAVRNAIRSVFE